MTESRQFSTFMLDGMLFGVDVLRVQEVIKYQEMTAVPLASKVIRGLINLRGQIVTAIDLRKRMGFKESEGGELPMNVIVRTEENAVSLLVDEIGDVVEVDQEDYEQPPEVLTGPVRELVKGVYKLKDKLLLILDTDGAVSLNEESQSR